MRRNGWLILVLLASVIAAPIVDVLACDGCSITAPLPARQSLVNEGCQGEGDLASAVPGAPAQQGSGTVQDICPICANSAAAMGAISCIAPAAICCTKPLPKLLAFADPTYSISKPPQN